MTTKNDIVALVGPTACGKTEVSLIIAEMMQTEIISADSVQIYEKLNIGSAKPTDAELKRVKHHLIDFVPLDAPVFSVSDYQFAAKTVVDRILEDAHTPLVVGGTGLYIQALTRPRNYADAISDEVFRKIWSEKEQLNPGCTFAELQKVDVVSSERLHPNDSRRVLRALEIFHLTGKTYAQHALENQKQKPLYSSKIFGLQIDTQVLVDRINQRVDLMINQGLIEEVEGIIRLGYDPKMPSLQGIGYKEIIQALQGKITIAEAIQQIKISTRQYAKRQRTWFRADKNIIWLNRSDYLSPEAIAFEIFAQIE